MDILQDPLGVLRGNNAQRGSRAERCTFQRLADSLLVQRMPAFVKRPKERGGEKVFVHPGCDTNIVDGKRGSERMNRLILSPPLEVITETFQHLDSKVPLLLTIVMTMQNGVVHGVELFGNGANHWH